jgi:hypothetical protein
MYGCGCKFFAEVNVPSIHNQREWQASNPYPLSRKERTSVSKTHENTHHHYHDMEEALSFGGSSKQKLLQQGMILPFQKSSITFDDITYSVDVPQVYSKHFNLSLSLFTHRLTILHTCTHFNWLNALFFSFSCPLKSQHQSTEYIIKLLVKITLLGMSLGVNLDLHL